MKRSNTIAMINVFFAILYLIVLWMFRHDEMFIPMLVVFIGSQMATWIPWWNIRRIERNNERNL